MNTSRLFTAAALALVIGAAAVAIPPAPVVNNAWQTGEQLTYQVKYGFFRAGTSVFAVEGEETLNGRRVVKFSSNITSSPGFFFRINDTARSFSDASSLMTYRYEKIQRGQEENSTNITVFNHGARSAQRTEDGHAHAPIPMVPNSIDVLGAIYYVRTQAMRVGQVLKFPVHDGKRDYGMEVTVRKAERITVPAGTFDCLMIEPRLRQADGTIRKKGQMTLWVTNDARKIPVQIRIQLGFGSLTASLQTMQGTR